MSKSLGNYIGINESAKDIFVKTMQIPDGLIVKYFELATDLHPDEIERIKLELQSGINPRDVKMKLAKEVTALYHGEEATIAAEEHFKNLFQKKEIPEDMLEVRVSVKDALIDAIAASKLVVSKSEAKRLVAQGGVKVNGEKTTDDNITSLKNNDVIQIGKRKFFKVEITD
jgi:tyrosyl-tRNA synthetase